MKNLLKVFLILFVFGFYSCKNESVEFESLETSNKVLLTQISSSDKSIIIDEIEQVFKDDKIKVIELIEIKKFKNLYIVSFKTKNNEIKDIGFENLFEEKDDNIKIDNTEWSVHCTGDCDCRLEGVMSGDEPYLQSSCDECVMHYSSKYITKKIDELKKEYNILDFAKKSYNKTFKSDAEEISITKIDFKEYKGIKVFTIHYNNNAGNISTFMIIQNYKSSNKIDAEARDISVDCHGTCDCRERFYFETGVVECTCDACEMDINYL